MCARHIVVGSRWKHRLLPATGQHYPSRVVCVDCDGELSGQLPNSARLRESLVSWHAVATYYRAGKPIREIVSAGPDPQSFWGWLAARLKSKTCTWLVCSPSGRTLALLDFWRRLEDGTATLERHLPRHHDGDAVRLSLLCDVCAGQEGERTVPPVRQGRHGPSGTCIIEDPPTIISCRLRDRPGSILIVDARNYGVDDGTFGAGAADRAQGIARFMVGQVSTLRSFGMGGLRPSAGSQAMYSLRSTVPCPAIFIHNHTAALRLERDGYHGGRVECFYIGPIDGPVYNLDIKSCYPWCASEHQLPCILADYAEGVSACRLLERAGGNDCIADVSVETHSADYPVLCTLRPDRPARPLHYWGDLPQTGLARLVAYPRGIYRTVLCGPELLDAMEARRITAIHRCASYAMGRPLERFYATWRHACDSAKEHGRDDLLGWLKRLGVSIIGKFGETGKRWLPDRPRTEQGSYASWQERSVEGKWERHRNIAGFHFREVISGESFDSCPGLAAWVCSLGRARLLRMLRAAGPANVYMVHTDCLLVNAAGRDNLMAAGLVRQSTWGYLRDSVAFKSAHVYGYSHYDVGGNVKCSGLPRGHVVDAGDGLHYRFVPSVAGQIRGGKRPDAVAEYHEWRRKQPYMHGRVKADGWVEPWEFL